MPGKLINHTLDNIVQGVTQQYQEGRYETQVEEMVNCIPSLSRGVLRRNPIEENVGLPELYNGLPTDPFTYVYDKGYGDEQYLIVIPGDTEGNWYIYRLANPTANYWTGKDPYLALPENSDVTAKQAFKALTLGDITFITNSTVEVKSSETLNAFSPTKYLDWAFYWIKMTTQVVTAQRTEGNDSGSKIEGYTYTLFDGVKHSVQAVKDTRPSETDPDTITAFKIAEKMASYESSWINDTDSAFVYDLGPKTQWTGSDTNGDTASLAVWKTVTNASELPLNLPDALDGFIVRVTGMSGIEEDDYFMAYDLAENTWVEVAEPGISIGVDPDTMPHCFYGLGTPGSRRFEFSTYRKVEDDVLGDSAWQERTVGDLTTNPDPKFVGNTINNLFFFKNRLGFISNDTLTLSRIGDYGVLYVDTLQVLKDDGPISLFVATTDINVLRHAVPTANTLVIFADEAQFILHSGNEPLTPITASINVISRYNYSPLVDATSYGNTILFTSISGGYTQVLELRMDDLLNAGGLQANAEVLSNHVPSYIPKDVQSIATKNILGYSFLHTNEASNALFVITNKVVQRQRVQLAFHMWAFDQDIAGIHTNGDYLYLVTQDGTLATISLETPGKIDDILYADKLNLGLYSPYTSGIWFSNFYFRDYRKLGSNRGRFQIRTILYDALGEYMTTITRYHKQLTDNQEDSCFYPVWDDNLTWIDDTVWIDVIPSYSRRYYSDKLITVMNNNLDTKIVFSNSEKDVSKGFELHTINVEALYYQRSTRT